MRRLVPLLPLLLLGCPQEPDRGFDRVPNPATAPCVAGGTSSTLVQQGVLAESIHVDCDLRDGVGGDAKFTGHSGQTSVVSGGSTTIALDYAGLPDLAGRTVYIAVDGEDGLFYTQLAGGSPLATEFFFGVETPTGEVEVLLGIDDGTGTFEQPRPVDWYTIRFNVVPVQTGDIQINVNWDTPTDIDLHVIDPNGERIYFGAPTSSSGGELDLDSNAGCTIDNINNENIYWPQGAAPVGEYQVYVDYWSSCGVTNDTGFRVTLLRDFVAVDVRTGAFQPAEADGDTETARLVLTFTYDGAPAP